MTIRSTAGLAAVALLFGAMACAGNTAGREGEDETAAAQDTSEVQNPPGYRGMERDTTLVPPDTQPADTFLQEQGTGVPEDTAGYSGLEQPDTTGAAAGDTSGAGWSDTTSTTGVDTTGQSSWDTTGQQ
jgi:hypothetical protein